MGLPMGLIVGTVRKVDRVRRVILLGETELWMAERTVVTGICEGMSITVLCEERDGKMWVRGITGRRPGQIPPAQRQSVQSPSARPLP